jgi:hypothetical protein
MIIRTLHIATTDCDTAVIHTGGRAVAGAADNSRTGRKVVIVTKK